MSTLVVLDAKKLQLVHAKVDALVNSPNRRVKEFFLDSLRQGHSHDSIGYLYEKTLEKFDKKNIGQYYTPKPIVEYMISQLEIKEDSNILDPSCGCGSFLLNIFDVCKQKYGVKFIENIFGVDINDDATNMTRLCLYAKAGLKGNFLSLMKNNIKTGNSLSSNKIFFKNAFDWRTEFSSIMSKGGFDFIIGNPPYVTISNNIDFNVSESIYADIIDGPVNAATLMIGRSLELLKSGGVLAFLLPKSMLYVDSYAKLRNYLTCNTEILQIYDLGSKFKDVRGEQFVLFVRKTTPNKESKTKLCSFTNKAKSLEEQTSIVIEQRTTGRMGKFLTFDNPAYYKLVSKLSITGIKLKETVEDKIFRGIPIGGNRVSDANATTRGESVIRGKDIRKFKLKSLHILNVQYLNTQSKARIDGLRYKKVVLQNIFSSESGVIAAYDAHNLLSLDTVTNIIVKDDLQGKYFVALLSSKLINFYIMYAIFNKSRLTMHLDKSYIGSVPFVLPKENILKKIAGLIDMLSTTEDSEYRKAQNRVIDSIIYKLYSLNKEEIALVEKATEKMLSKKSLW